MKKIFAILLIATLCIMNASLAFATEATSLHASDDIVSEIQMDISSADIQSWAETSDAYLDYENVVPVYTTMNVSADSNSLVDTLSFKNEYSIPVVTESGDCLGAFTVVNSNGVWMWIFLCGSTAVPEERIPPIQRQETAVPEQRYRT